MNEDYLRGLEDAAVAAWMHYMDTCKKHGHGPDVERIRDFCAADAIRKLKGDESNACKTAVIRNARSIGRPPLS